MSLVSHLICLKAKLDLTRVRTPLPVVKSEIKRSYPSIDSSVVVKANLNFLGLISVKKIMSGVESRESLDKSSSFLFKKESQFV